MARKVKKTDKNADHAHESTSPNVVIIEPESNSRSSINAMLEAQESFGDIFVCGDYEEGMSLMKLHRPDLLILGNPDDPERALLQLEKVALAYPNVTTFFSAPIDDSNFLIRAMRAGAREFFRRPIQEDEFNAACGRFFSSRALHGLSPQKNGKVISLFGVKGGLGTTTIATNLAVNFESGLSKKVVIMDANFQSGSVGVFLDMHPKVSLMDLMRDLDQIEPNSLARVLPQHPSGIYFLAPPRKTNGSFKFSSSDLDSIFTLLRVEFDYIVIDLDREMDNVAAHLIDLTDLLLLVVNLDIPSLVNTNRMFDSLRRLGYDEEKVMLISNRHINKNEFMLDEFEQITKKSVGWKIPNHKYGACLNAMNRGEPLATNAERSKLNQSINKLAKSIDENLHKMF